MKVPMLKRFFAALSGAALLAASAALAQAPAVHAHDGARYASGGIGDDERAAMQAMRGEFNVFVTFAAKRGGNYLADVAVAVENNTGGEVFATEARGPWLYAHLTPGRYRLTATYSGKREVRQFTVPAKGRVSMYLYWEDPSALETDELRPKGMTD